jgi:hypothetical protein
MKTAMVVLDEYKLPFFEKKLKEAGIEFTIKGEVVKGSIGLQITGESMAQLLEWRPIIETINREATKK